MNKEIWKNIPEYTGLYQASNFGRIKSLKRIIKGYNPKIHKFIFHSYPERILKPGKDKDNRLHVVLCKYGLPKSYTIHKLVMLTFIGSPISDDIVIHHIDGNSLNNNLKNLKYITNEKNLLIARNYDKILGRRNAACRLIL